MSSGLIDTAVPPMTALSIYNTLQCPKQIDLVPLVGHNQGPHFKEMRTPFLVKQAEIPDPSGNNAGTPINMGAPINK